MKGRIPTENKLGGTEFRATQFSVSTEQSCWCYFLTAMIRWKLLMVPRGTPDHT